MEKLDTDPAVTLNRIAQAERWPFHCDSALNFERDELNTVRDIWRSLAAGKTAPFRADFDARTLKPFLRNISIVERVFVDTAKWRYRRRLRGSLIAELDGDGTGQFLDEFIPSTVLRAMMICYDAILGASIPMRFAYGFTAPHQLSYLRGESLSAPVCDAHGELSLILICTYFMPRRSSGKA